ncbi:MAG: hypothetical protein R3C56_43410 [Pirellulaceae bacterium]
MRGNRVQRPASVLLDLHLFFTPLMHEFGDGIVFTQTFTLPFPPSPKIAIGGRSVGEVMPLLGYKPRDIVWDVDRQVFLASTHEIHQSSPLAFIPLDMALPLENGWRIGSWQKHYDRSWRSPIGDKFDPSKFEFDWEDENELEKFESQQASHRPEQFNQLFSALIRMLFTLRNNESTAYAMYKSKTYFDSEQSRSEKYSAALRTFESMSHDDQEKTRRNVLRRCARFG